MTCLFRCIVRDRQRVTSASGCVGSRLIAQSFWQEAAKRGLRTFWASVRLFNVGLAVGFSVSLFVFESQVKPVSSRPTVAECSCYARALAHVCGRTFMRKTYVFLSLERGRKSTRHISLWFMMEEALARQDHCLLPPDQHCVSSWNPGAKPPLHKWLAHSQDDGDRARLKAMGNCVVPAQARLGFELLLELRRAGVNL